MNEKDKSVIIGKDTNNNFLGNWLTDTKMGTEMDGILKTESFDGKEKSEVTYKNGKVLKLVETKNDKTQTTKLEYPEQSSISADGKIVSTVVVSNLEGFNDEGYGELPSVVVTGYIYSQPTNFYSLFWSTNQNPTYLYSFNYSTSGGGVSDGPTLISPTHPIPDINLELKCFSTNATSSYKITLNINQPNPGSRNLWKGTGSEKVGHAYLTLEQDNANGTKVIRNVGFYPKNSASPASPSDVSIFGDDSYTPAAVSLKITVSSTDFGNALQSIKNQVSTGYNLNNFNCTTSVLTILNSINIHITTLRHSGYLFLW